MRGIYRVLLVIFLVLIFQVKKIEVQYDKTSKQIDVHILKKTLQDLMQESIQMSEAVRLFL